MEIDPEGRYYRPVFNILAAEKMAGLPERVTIKDETLREGEETPGVYLTLSQKLDVAARLEEAGIRETEVGYSGAVDEHYEFTKALKASGSRMRLSSHTRGYTRGDAWKAEIDRALEAGADILNLGIRSSRCLLEAYPWLTQEMLPERISQVVEYGKRQGAFVAFGPADPVRTNFTTVVQCFDAAYRAGADRLYVFDGTGSAGPEAMASLVELARQVSHGELEIAIHCHDDLGLAVAGTLAGVRAGASVVDTVVNGLGDRAGNAALEQVVAALAVVYGIETDVPMEKLYALSQYVSEVYRVPIPAVKPVVGENVYLHETDGHILGILRGSWHSWEVIRAEALGRSRSLQFGPGTLHSGDNALAAKIQRMGLEATEAQKEDITAALREGIRERGFASEEEVEGMIRRVMSQK
jgi:2-isopropylmalate synthase